MLDQLERELYCWRKRSLLVTIQAASS